MFHHSSHPVLHFTTLAATRRCRCLLRGAFMWVVMPCRLVPCDLGDPGGGDPWFPHGTLLLHSLAGMAWWVWCFVFCWFCHTNEMIQCYHLLHQLIFRPWTGNCHTAFVLFVLGFCFGVLCVFVFCLFLCLVFLFRLLVGDFATEQRTMYRSLTSSFHEASHMKTACWCGS